MLTDITGELIPREIDGFVIHQRAKDGCVNATAMCKVAGKMIGHWSQNAETKKVLESLSRSIGIPMDLLVDTIVTGTNEHRGTWVHPKVAIHLATWCSSDFYAQFINWVYDWVVEAKAPVAPVHDFSDPLATAKLYIEAEEGRRQAATKLAESEQLIGMMGSNIEQLGAKASQLAEKEVVKEAELADGVREFRREPRQSVFRVCHRIGARGSHMGQAAGVPPHAIERGVESEPA